MMSGELHGDEQDGVKEEFTFDHEIATQMNLLRTSTQLIRRGSVTSRGRDRQARPPKDFVQGCVTRAATKMYLPDEKNSNPRT